MELTNKELNLIDDGLSDTIIRFQKGELDNESIEYFAKIKTLSKRIETELIK